MDVERLAGALSGAQREKIAAVGRTDAAKAVERLFTDAELIDAASGGDEAAIRDVLRRVLSTSEGRRLAEMLGEAMK